MRIVHVSRQYAPALGGLEAVVEALARLQVAEGDDVAVVTLNRVFGTETRLPATEMVDGVKVIRLPYAGSRRYPIAPSVLLHIRDADVVHVHAIDFFFDFLALTKAFHGKKLIVSTHGGFFHTKFASRLKNLYFRTVTKSAMRSYSFVAASSQHDFEIFKRIRREGIAAVTNGVDIDKFGGRGGEPALKRLIYFGRISENKNIPALLPFMRSVRQHDPAWRLVIAGRFEERTKSELTLSADEFGLADAVEFVDRPTDDELASLIETCCAFVSPSAYEGFGIAAIEAMSAGLMPVLSDIVAHRDTVGQTEIGLLVDFSDPEAAASLFLSQFQRWAEGFEVGQRPSERLDAYAWPQVAKRFADIYRDILGHQHRHILSLKVKISQMNGLVDRLDQAVKTKETFKLGFVNAHLATLALRRPDLNQVLQRFYLVNDGVGVDIASLILFGSSFPQNLNGTDMVPYYLTHSRRSLRIYLLGGEKEVVQRAADLYALTWPQHRVVGHHDGFFAPGQETATAAAVRAANPDVVLVGMGSPRQEQWIAKHVPDVCSVAVCVGALFDFQVGRFARAPAIYRTTRMEWLYRLALEPKRLAPRYLFGGPMFLGNVLLQLYRGHRA